MIPESTGAAIMAIMEKKPFQLQHKNGKWLVYNVHYAYPEHLRFTTKREKATVFQTSGHNTQLYFLAHGHKRLCKNLTRICI